MLFWNLNKEKDGLVPKLYTVLPGLSYLNCILHAELKISLYDRISGKTLQPRPKITFIQKLFHRKWLIKNHSEKCQRSTKEDALFVTKEFGNLLLLDESC